MEARDSALASERLRLALSLFDMGVRMFRAKLRRTQPMASDEEIEAKVADWLARRPGAEDGDSVGRRISWPRTNR